MALFLSVAPWAAFHGLPTACFLCVQAEEGRRAPKAKVAKIIKETILLFSGHHLFLLTLFINQSQQKK